MEKTKKPTKAQIKASLIKQLEAKGANVAHFMDLIYDYMSLYDIKKDLQKDVKERGVAYETTSANGYPIIKQNQSVKDLVAVEKQMLQLLKEMGLTTDEPTGNEMIDEDLCKEQLLLCDFVEKVFAEEDVYVDEKQLERYLGLQKHFPYKLLPWEQFCFALHNCVYRRDGQLRFPVLVILVGRGAGKNGYLAFEDFALMTPINGVKYYHIAVSYTHLTLPTIRLV